MNKNIKPNEPANFTPEMGNYKPLKPFRYWCQKVLPLVYDDSLSYYELLCKVVDYLNKTMEDVETLHGDVNNLHKAYEELQNYVNNYFSTLDVQEEINEKLDNMVSTGELTTLILPYIKSSPVIVNSLNEMTNPNYIYLLSTDGYLYSWSGNSFKKSGINYSYPANAYVQKQYRFMTSNDLISSLNECGSYSVGVKDGDNFPADMPPGWTYGNYMVVVDGYMGADKTSFIQNMYRNGEKRYNYRMITSNKVGEWTTVNSSEYHKIKVALCGDSFIGSGGDGGLPMSEYLNEFIKYDATSLAKGGVKASEWWGLFKNQVTSEFDVFLLSLGLNGETSTDIFINSINNIIDNITAKNPTARIILWCMDAWYTEEYSNACHNIAMQRGIEFYSMKADKSIPIRIGGKFTTVFPTLNSNYAKTKTDAYTISATDSHPNIKARKMLAEFWSTII